jgi:hypothetical protein
MTGEPSARFGHVKSSAAAIAVKRSAYLHDAGHAATVLTAFVKPPFNHSCCYAVRTA